MHPTQGNTDCKQQTFGFQALGSRRVEADFSGGHLSSEGGALLLREVDRIGRLSEQLAGCFSDRRNRHFVEHDLAVLLRQRVMGIALGYEDLNDHDRLRLDPLMAAVCGRADVLGQKRHMEEDRASRWRAKARSTGWSLARKGRGRCTRSSCTPKRWRRCCSSWASRPSRARTA
jgi:hypothetical protein